LIIRRVARTSGSAVVLPGCFG